MLIGLTGRLACGKGFVADILKELGFDYITVSNIVRKEAARLGIPILRGNLQDLGNKVRKEEGGGAWVRKIIKKMDPTKNYVFDGIRNPGEIEELKKAGNLYLIAIDASQQIRYKRVLKRAKPSDPKTWEGFLEMDERDFGKNEPEYGQQVEKCMKMADVFLINNSSVDDFKRKIEKLYPNIK